MLVVEDDSVELESVEVDSVEVVESSPPQPATSRPPKTIAASIRISNLADWAGLAGFVVEFIGDLPSLVRFIFSLPSSPVSHR